ncbi:MAG: hypothetical protein BMS9Abin05_2494 [Rhodothermia bacterium]|nr:MAG: hypothetical protein BMS9Abin05_2494 [Rhodothermia bacterium]
MPETMIRISLSETARRHGIDKGQLSRDVHAGKKSSRGCPICHYATKGSDGRIQGFVFPDSFVFPASSGVQNGSKLKKLAVAIIISGISVGFWLARKSIQIPREQLNLKRF